MSREKQIEKMDCKKCLHYEMCLENFREAKKEGLWELTDEEEYFSHADECDFYAAGYSKQSEWISVEERLPDNYGPVLVACVGTMIGGAAPIAIGSYGGGFWSLADADGMCYLTKYMHVVVTHWMPLPEPPKMKGGEDNAGRA